MSNLLLQGQQWSTWMGEFGKRPSETFSIRFTVHRRLFTNDCGHGGAEQSSPHQNIQNGTNGYFSRVEFVPCSLKWQGSSISAAAHPTMEDYERTIIIPWGHNIDTVSVLENNVVSTIAIRKGATMCSTTTSFLRKRKISMYDSLPRCVTGAAPRTQVNRTFHFSCLCWPVRTTGILTVFHDDSLPGVRRVMPSTTTVRPHIIKLSSMSRTSLRSRVCHSSKPLIKSL